METIHTVVKQTSEIGIHGTGLRPQGVTQSFTDYTLNNPAPEWIVTEVARLYNTVQYKDEEGKINPFDLRYTRGGCHFSRDAAWFKEMLQRPGAHLLIGVDPIGEATEIVTYSLFFTRQNDFPEFARDCNYFASIRGEPQLGYTYLLLKNPEKTFQGAARQLFEEQVKICTQEGCDLLVHEVFVKPSINEASL